jgi:hypothetical protein
MNADKYAAYMDTENTVLKYPEVTDQILNAFYTVYNTLGYGFLEKVYENAIIIELSKSGLNCLPQAPIRVVEVGLLLNFGVRPEFKRKAFDNDRK